MPRDRTGSPGTRSLEELVGEFIIIMECGMCCCYMAPGGRGSYRWSAIMQGLYIFPPPSFLPFVGMVTILMNDYPKLKVRMASSIRI